MKLKKNTHPIKALYNMQKKGIGCDFTLISSEVQNCHVTLHSFVLQEFSTFLLPKGYGFQKIRKKLSTSGP